MTTVLIGFAGSLAAPEVAWSLLEAGYRVVAFARRGRPSALKHSRHVEYIEITAPEISVEAASAELIATMRSMSPDGARDLVLLPLDDASVYLCQGLTFTEGWTTAGPNGPLASLALDKELQIAAANAAGFAVPKSFLAENAEEVLGGPIPFPSILRSAKAVIQ